MKCWSFLPSKLAILTRSLTQVSFWQGSEGLSLSMAMDMFRAMRWTCLLCLVWSQGCRWCRWRLTSPDSRWRRSLVWRITGVSVWPGALQEPKRAKRHLYASHVSSALLSYSANILTKCYLIIWSCDKCLAQWFSAGGLLPKMSHKSVSIWTGGKKRMQNLIANNKLQLTMQQNGAV